MESLAIILICDHPLPPLLMSHGFDLVWFGIIVVVVTEIALITPPIGMNVFVLKAALPHVRLGAIFHRTLPSSASTCCACCCWWPSRRSRWGWWR